MGGGSTPPSAFNVFEVADDGEKSIEYVVEAKKMKNKGAEFLDESGRRWRLVCTVPTEEEAQARKEKLEQENLCWGAFWMVQEDGEERFEAKRIPKSHPKKFKDRYGKVWHLAKKCSTEEKADKAIEHLQEKQAHDDGPGTITRSRGRYSGNGLRAGRLRVKAATVTEACVVLATAVSAASSSSVADASSSSSCSSS